MIRIMLSGTVALLSALTAAQSQQVSWPSPEWLTAGPSEVKLDAAKLEEAQNYALSAGGSGLIVRHGKVVLR